MEADLVDAPMHIDFKCVSEVKIVNVYHFNPFGTDLYNGLRVINIQNS